MAAGSPTSSTSRRTSATRLAPNTAIDDIPRPPLRPRRTPSQAPIPGNTGTGVVRLRGFAQERRPASIAAMIIVAGHLRVDPVSRAEFLDNAVSIIRMGRSATGCMDFHLSADPIEADRINVFERWSSRNTLEAFRGSGPSRLQAQQILNADVVEYEVTG